MEEQILREQQRTNELLETILNTKQSNLPKLLYAKEIAENYRVNVNTATQFCKKYGTNFGGYCIELEKFKEILQTKGMQIFN
uniref:Transcriptional regulator n=1 Tax=Siphoviridae sp. ctES717 TaxID=2827564 RepID=A0A8S5RSQ2_9CAUD|nr:MAG TPA: Transcriptional regulator [Siphoviridae sp. ctES717]